MSTEAWATIIAGVNLLVTASIALIVMVQSNRFAKLQMEREIRSAWMAVDNEALRDPASLEAFDALFHPADQGSITNEERRRRWISYLIRNPLEMTYEADIGPMKHTKGSPRPAMGESIGPLMGDPMFRAMLHYSPTEFVTYCNNLMNKATTS